LVGAGYNPARLVTAITPADCHQASGDSARWWVVGVIYLTTGRV
jgi:hypothetical protein